MNNEQDVLAQRDGAVSKPKLGVSDAQSDQVGWVDEFGNLFPLGAWKPRKATYHDDHKAAWRPVYATAAKESEHG